jgi:hypothetical protein
MVLCQPSTSFVCINRGANNISFSLFIVSLTTIKTVIGLSLIPGLLLHVKAENNASSPGDVNEERQTLADVIDKLNEKFARSRLILSVRR